MSKASLVYHLLQQVPAGKVTTYKALALLAQVHPRQIGTILHRNPNPDRYPCHRVVNWQGRLAPGFAFGGPAAQARLLKAEGIELVNDRVMLARYFYQPRIDAAAKRLL